MADVIMGSDHGYGLAWFQQKRENGKATFEQRWIETEYPSIHTMTLADLDGDGQPELIAGKQMFAHNGEDVGSYEPQFIFYYTFHGDQRAAAHHHLHAGGAVLRAGCGSEASAAHGHHRPGDAGERGRHGWRRQERHHRGGEERAVHLLQPGGRDACARVDSELPADSRELPRQLRVGCAAAEKRTRQPAEVNGNGSEV